MDSLHIQNNLGTFIMNRKRVRCIQINLQHSRSATDNLMKKTDDEEPDLILIQEPYEYQNRITGFYVYGSVHHNIFYEITNRCSYMQSILFHC
jgi:hypothetical protein